MFARTAFALGAACLFAAALALAPQQRAERVIDEGFHHLGNDQTPDWKEAPADPEGARLDLRFDSAANRGEWLLKLEQRSVDDVWTIELNGEAVAPLRRMPDRVERRYPIPAGAVRSGENVLSFVPARPSDDVVIGNIRLVEASLREIYALEKIEVSVRDTATRTPLPARVTFVRADGSLAPLYYADSPVTAARDGVLYVGPRAVEIEIEPGEYRSFATRGVEWGLSERAVTVAARSRAKVEHALERELDTTGFVAADTHIHTLTYSGHGDALIEERVVTLAGEGVELAVATDHNHNTDYRPLQRSQGFDGWYTAVTGNEVTTDAGHFNGFPLRPGDAVPPHDLQDIVKIVQGIRASGAKVVILNHPRWPAQKGPFDVHALSQSTGASTLPSPLPVDATELVNSTNTGEDPRQLLADWFGLLNRGERVFAVGSSDSHTVGEPVGQGRTYVASATDDPARIDVDACCEAIANGRTSIGMGAFVTVAVEGRFVMGETIREPRPKRPTRFDIRVQAPSWSRPDRAQIYLDGTEVASFALAAEAGKPLDARLAWTLDRPLAHDVWLVVFVSGPGVRQPYWPQDNDYVMALTNPVFIDADGSGYESPRATAALILETATEPSEVDAAFQRVDAAVAAHLRDLLERR
jgi:hypothetical protein